MVRILKKSDKCHGCSACKNICPVSAIIMEEDHEGFKVPIIDETKCINCNLCVKVCPENDENKSVKLAKYSLSNTAYAMKNRRDKIRKKSASGAFFPAIAELILKNGGYIVGCVLDENLIPVHIVTDNKSKIEDMQDSKYVQSDMCDSFREIGGFLKKGKKVLFTGTSCQVAGLNSYLTLKKIGRENLLTVDFFCHGVPSPKIWESYLQFYSEKKKRKVSGYRFRSKKYGWGIVSRGSNHLNTIKYRNGKKEKEDNISYIARMWRSIFFSNLVLRRFCANCPYATVNKPSDITMGDFWGINDVEPSFDDGKGSSLLISHNIKGEKAIKMLQDKDYVDLLRVNLGKAIEKQSNAFAPSKVDWKRREAFWNDLNKNGLEFCAEKYFNYNAKSILKGFVKRILFEMRLRDIY